MFFKTKKETVYVQEPNPKKSRQLMYIDISKDAIISKAQEQGIAVTESDLDSVRAELFNKVMADVQTSLQNNLLAAHTQLGISWGSAGSPNCRGITPEEFSQLNLDQVDFSAWIANFVNPAVGSQAADMLERMQLP